MNKRPYFSKTTDELAEIFERSKDNIKTVKAIVRELNYRSRPKAKKLKALIENFLANNATHSQEFLPFPDERAQSLPSSASQEGIFPTSQEKISVPPAAEQMAPPRTQEAVLSFLKNIIKKLSGNN